MSMKIKYIVLCLLLALVGCQRDEEMEMGQISVSNERLEASYSSVLIGCSFQTNVTIKNVQAYLSTEADFSSAKSYSLTEKEKNTFGATIEGLKDASTYYVRYEVSNRWSSKMIDEVSEFKTIPYTIPTVQTSEVSDVTHSTAIVGGVITENGGQEITERGVVYSKSPNPSIENGTKVESLEKAESYACTLMDLEYLTTYYVRAYAINEKGIAYGEEVSFKTGSTTAAFDTLSISDVTATSAVISGALLNNGGEFITSLGVCCGVNHSPTLEDATVINAELDDLKFSVRLNDLQKGTTYYVRAYATNSHGTVYSEELYFNTEMTIPAVTTTPATDISYTSATVGGKVTEDGGASVTERGVVYSTNQSPTTEDSKVVIGSGLGEFTCSLTDLQDGVTYYARAYAVNEKGIAYGDEVRFTTKTKTIAIVATTPATNVFCISATVGGNVTEDGGAEVTERGVVYATTQNPTTNNTKVTSGIGTGSFTCNLTDLQPNTTYYVRAYAVNSKGTAYGEEVTFTTKANVNISDPTGTENGYGYVDLGLSVKWATMNVGASSPEDYGDYFAWGEVEPKDYYDWSTYKYCNGSNNSLTKYNNNSNYGTVDNKTQLELTDDVARANWGGSWRMPTEAEMTELREQCTWTWTTQNGVNGCKVTSKSNGNSIFLPAAGYRGSSSGGAGREGEYWSSSLETGSPDGARGVNFDSSNAYRNGFYRYAGLSVRPVLGENEVEGTTPTVTTTTVTQITETTAVAGGNVTSDGGASVTERGVVYSTNPNPVITNLKNTIRPCGSGTGAFTYNMTGLQSGTTYYVRAYAKNDVGTAYGEEVSFTTQEQSSTPNDGTENGYAYVNLGLSVKWATMNVGASSPEDYGDYFAWGETEPKTTYNWSTYKWCNGSSNTLTKYNNSSSYGTVDNKTQLELTDDAARANWGGSWRMPTDAELTELREQCTWTLTTQNGVKGYKVTSKSNGNSIFLPAAGLREYSSLYDAGSYGYFWSGSLCTDYPEYAWGVYFTSISVHRNDFNRSYRDYGFSVRPVLGENEVEVTTPTVTTATVTQITETTAVAGGNVTSDGGASVTERGVVYSTNPNPVITNLNNTIRPCGSGIGVFTYNMTGLQSGTTYYVRTYAKNDVGTAYGEEVSFTTKEQSSTPSNGTENGYAYVDLGLSVKWATMNVGASKPEDYGDYYAWGETTTQTEYNWSTYKYCYTYYNNLTKYNTYSIYGTVDNKTTLELGDDAARAKLGGAWRLPTEAELLELREQCTWTWTTQNGVNGYKVTSKSNGNNIFLPAAGYRMDSKLKVVGSDGCYWANSISSNLPYCAWRLDFNASEVKWNGDNRCYGQSVRPVCP